ncbi:MAG: hypothetical protein QOF32_1507, partial [Gammaproteobacteria bacterium]|nr:hypothetical protein [Gammaproteobacteria bacterium]
MGPKLADDLSAAETLWHYTSFQ